MGDYTAEADVELRLRGKVRFTDDDKEENAFPRSLLKKLVRDAEVKVERDLSRRYATPFRGTNDEAFKTLPKTTRETITNLCELQSVMLVMMTDFGRGGVSDSRAYRRGQMSLYTSTVKRELDRNYESAAGQWRFPPLEGLKLADGNASEQAIVGAILHTSNGDGAYPSGQITDPGESIWLVKDGPL